VNPQLAANFPPLIYKSRKTKWPHWYFCELLVVLVLMVVWHQNG